MCIKLNNRIGKNKFSQKEFLFFEYVTLYTSRKYFNKHLRSMVWTILLKFEQMAKRKLKFIEI